MYAHFGALVLHLALWFLSVFGMFEDGNIRWENDGQRLLFTLLWAVVACGFILGGSRFGIGLLSSYGLVFLLINLYTFYFQFVAANSPELWWIHLLLMGGTLLALGFRLERRLRESRSVR